MEITELQQSITKANQAVENAQAAYDKVLAKVTELETAYTLRYERNNPAADVVDVDQYLQVALKTHYENLALEKQNLALEKQNLARKEANLAQAQEKELLILRERKGMIFIQH
jgi:hypothetical protein